MYQRRKDKKTMGIMNLLGILETDQPIEEKVRLHLATNCYPPVPSEIVSVCLLAVNLAREGKADAEIGLPLGMVYLGNKSSAPASAIIDNYHLNLFVSAESEDG
jgi:hypothetical protein